MEERIERNNCILCNSLLIEFQEIKMNYSIYKCKECNMVFAQNPFLEKKYQEIYDYEIKEREKMNQAMRNEAKLIWSFLDKYNWNGMVKRGNFLDIGCNSGVLLHFAKKNKWETFGIDISQKAIEKCKERELEAKVSSIEDFDTNKKFNLISLIDVIEHVQDIVKSIAKIWDLLAEKGKLVLTTPIKATGWWGTGTHINYFSIDTLELLLRDKFAIIASEKHPNDYNIILLCEKKDE